MGVDIPRLERLNSDVPLVLESRGNGGIDTTKNETETSDSAGQASSEEHPEREPDHGTAILATLLADQSNAELVGRSAKSDQQIMSMEIAAVSILVEENLKRYACYKFTQLLKTRQ